jgi:tetratricopeptide (TPR) repeat protein
MSGIIICPSCGAKVRARHERCPRCRTKFEQAFRPRLDVNFNRFAPAAVAVLAIVGTVAGYALWRQSSEPVVERVAAAAVAPARAPKAGPARPPAPVRLDYDGATPFLEANRAGSAAYGAGAYETALAEYKKAVEKNPGDAESWSNLGQVLVRLKRVEEALTAFQRAIALNADRWAYHFNLARAQGLTGRWDLAVNEYRQAQRLLPDDYAVTFNLGLALRNAGDAAAAAEQLEKAAALNPEDASFRLALARTYEQLGRRQDAVSAYQHTLRLAPDATEAPVIRARIDALLK